MTQINWQYQVNNRAGGYIVSATDWNDFAGNFRALIDQTTSSTTDNSPLPIGIDLANDRVYISDPDSTTPEDANHANTTLSVVGTTTLAGNTQQTGTFTVGVDDTGYDVKFFGATSGKYMEWDESADQLDVTGALDVTGNTSMVGTLTVGVDDTGHDVKFFGATSGKYMEWDESADQLDVTGALDVTGTMNLTAAVLSGGSPLVFEGATDNGYETTFAITDPTADRTITFKDGTGTVAFTSDITTTSPAGSDHDVQFNNSGSFGADSNFTYDGSTVTIKAALTVGVDDTGHDVIFYGATSANSFFFWDQSEDALQIAGHTTLGNNTTNYLNFKTGTSGTEGLIRWMFNTTSTVYASMGITYDDRASHGFYLDSAYPITLDATTSLNLEIAGVGYMSVESDGDICQYGNSSGERYNYMITDGGNCSLYMANGNAKGTNGGMVYTSAEHLFFRANTGYQWYISSAGTLRPYGTNDDLLLLSNSGSGDTSSVVPGLGFVDDTDAGFYLYSSGNVAGCTAGSRRIQFSSSGLYAIKATNNSSSYAGWSTATGYLVAKTSSIRYKENVKDIPKSEWEKIYNLQARSFDWKESAFASNAFDANRKDDHGFIAEEVNEHLPYAIIWDKDHEDPDSKRYIQSVAYGELTPYLVEAVKDLKARIEELEKV